MKTDELVTLLATGTGSMPVAVPMRRYAVALGAGMLGAVLLMFLFMGVRADLGQAVMLPMFWVKAAFVACLALTSGLVAWRLSRPGVRLAGMPGALAAPVIAMWALAAFVLVNADPTRREQLLMGGTSSYCPFFIALLSVPVFVAVIWAMNGLAPTRLRLAGAAAGLVSGSLGALVYSLHCTEMSAPFLGVWYVLGLMIPTAVGALMGPRWLRW